MPVDAKRLKIVTYPASVLRVRATPIKAITPEIKAVAARMLDLMHDAPGVGLAAPQVGLSWRMFVACASRDAKDDQVFINPVLSDPSRDLEEYEEGCLSIPGVTAAIRRPKAITISALDLDGKPVRMTSEELAARVWQHETDHLDGVLIIDKMTPMDKLANQRVLRDLEKG
jgi:peptide deformylase